MANTLTAIIPTLQDSANTVAREMAGFSQACYKNVSANRAGKDQTVKYPIVPKLSTANATPAATSPAGADITQESGEITMDKFKKVTWNWTGEEVQALENGDIAPYEDIMSQTMRQAFRALVNLIEADLWAEAYQSASRGYGTAGTTPFGTADNLTDFSGVQQILDENGTPMNRCLVVGHAAMNNLRGKQSSLFKVNEAGSEEFLRTGNLGSVMGLKIFHSDPITTHTKGTGTSYLLNDASSAVGDTTIATDTGSGTILAGDVVTFAGTSDKYIVNSALSGGSFDIGEPGLIAAEADNDAITVGDSYIPNVAFEESALHLVMRQPNTGQDSAMDVVNVRDDFTGLQFQLARYGQYLQSSFELRCLYGVKAVKSDFIANLLG